MYLVRHGATEANLRRPYLLQGQRIDLPLSETGHLQAQAARTALADRPIELIFSSPLRRATETAQIIAAPHRAPVRTVAELIECDVGRWEGLSWEAIRQQDATHWQAFQSDPGATPYAGGESFAQVQSRVVAATERLLRDHTQGDLLIVTHNIVARVYVAHLLGIAVSQARSIRQDNGGISVIALCDGTAKLLTLNSILHLNGLLE
jgi:broad specificity phosphatase PhoE